MGKEKEDKVISNIKIIGTVLLLLAIIVIPFFIPNFSPEEVRKFIQDKGNLGPLVYIILFTILPAFFFPVPVLAIAAGLAFGFWAALLYTIIGACLNFILTFLLSRGILHDRVQTYLEKSDKAETLRKFMRGNNAQQFWLLIALRLIPIIPYSLINYAYGLTGISLKKYTLASLLGILPGTVLMVNIGDSVMDLEGPGLYISIALLLLLIAIGYFLSKKLLSAKDKENVN